MLVRNRNVCVCRGGRSFHVFFLLFFFSLLLFFSRKREGGW